ncbi:Tat pathway signal sequence domain protein [Streptomyces sp. NBC_00536]|uniref:Tat pathway signal sequence domain protein n=1 Tax=Streptomyces sp. NBC_00536 TaxID=2975769 RepID=UPI002E8005F8|nr:Tat pathway signal sequence domain protein [Streptomyces sp. NBC_00536]WUC78466.1 Tat pathway signal sequence domain protein [Streptomyces sp. NBC_00536]
MSGMSGIGPVEPGEGTAGHEPGDLPGDPPGTLPGGPASAPRALLERVRARCARHRLALAAAALAAALGLGGGYLYAVRPRPPAPVPAPPPAAPSQTLALDYGEPEPPETTPEGIAFEFTVRARTSSGPPVTIERIGQPSRALTVTVRPPSPVVVAAGEVREVVVQIHVADCVHVARNAGLPFLEVTLSNGFRKEDHAYILGDRYARDLSTALTRACPVDRDAGSTPGS